MGNYTVALVPVTASSLGCVKTARLLDYAVPCPSMLPQAVLGGGPFCLATFMSPGWLPRCADSRKWRGWMVASGGMPVFGLGVAPAEEEHFVMEAAPFRTSNYNLIANGPVWPSLGRPHTVKLLGRITIGGRRMRWVVVPTDTEGSSMAGHLMLVWPTRSHTYAFGFHILWGRPLARGLDIAVASHLVMVRP